MSPSDHIKNASHLHHAYVVEGDISTLAVETIDALAGRGVSVLNNPDMFVASYERLLADDARGVVNFASLAPVSEKKYIIVSASSMTEEAQSALLKAVEDGSGHSTFFFLVARGTPLLPTLLSRCVSLRVESAKEEEHLDGREFLASSYAQRISLIESLAKAHDRDRVLRIVRDLLSLHETKPFSKEVLADLLTAHSFLSLSGSSIKVALGHIALTLDEEQ